MAEGNKTADSELNLPSISGIPFDDEIMVSPSPGIAAVQSFSFMASPFAKGVKGSVNFSDFVSPSKEGEISMEFSPGSLQKSSQFSKSKTNQPEENIEHVIEQTFKKNKKQRKPVRGDLFSSKEETLDNTLRVSEDSFFSLGSGDEKIQNKSSKVNQFPSKIDSSNSQTGQILSGGENKKYIIGRGLFLSKEENQSELKLGGDSLFSLGQSEDSFNLHPADIFASSPNSPDTPVLSLWAHDGSSVEHSHIETSSSKQTDYSFRRCRSQEIRKNLFDLSNTPPNTFARNNSMSKRSLFKRPLDIQVKEKNLSKRMRECSQPSSVGLSLPQPLNFASSPVVSALDQERIKSAVDSLQSGELVSDGSRNYCLPIITGKHHDLRNIHHQTMADLLNGKYEGSYDTMTVIDCRYPYEFKGGRIRDAINIYTEKEIFEFLSQEIEELKSTNSVHILVFHCEFSSQRGPSLSRHLRQCDRQINLMEYPKLMFPEIYCMYGGYKEFFAHHPELCSPRAYVTMIDDAHTAAYLHFRARAKTWSATDGGRKAVV